MKQMQKLVYFFVIFAAATLLTCSDSESKLKAIPSGQTAVIISLGLAPENPTAYDDTIWNRIRRLFVRDAMAQTAPATFGSISVTVTGADMTPVQQTFSPAETIVVNVLAGTARQFSVVATVAPGDPSAALSFSGTATSDLAEGQTVTLPISMALNETKIVVPDQYNYRIVQINDITGNGWIERTAANIGFPSNFYPNDVDFDNRGRIYIANNFAVTGSDVVIRINNMDDTSCLSIGTGSGSSIMSIAIDRIRNYVYYATSMSVLKRCGLDGSGDTALTISGGPGPISLFSIRGIDVEQTSGDLFIACSFDLGAPQQSVARASITGTTATIVAYQPLIGTAGETISWDVIVKSSNLYVAELYQGVASDNRNRIIQFDLGLTTAVGSAPFLTQDPVTTQAFLGPHRFLAVLNRKIYVINENENEATNNNEGIIGFDDITGANWSSFRPTDIGQSEFLFYSIC